MTRPEKVMMLGIALAFTYFITRFTIGMMYGI